MNAVRYIIELAGKRVSSRTFTDIAEASREAEALDAIFPGSYHDVGTIIVSVDSEQEVTP